MRRGLAAIAMLLGSASTARAAPVFTLEVDRPGGAVGDNFVATVKLEIPGGLMADEFTPPDFPGLTVADSQLNQTTTDDLDPMTGRRDRRTVEVRRYLLRATRLGHLVLGPARCHIAGQLYESNQTSVDVVAGAAPVDPDPTAAGQGAPGYRKPHPAGQPAVFLHAAIDNPTPFVGEQVTVTWMLFTGAEEVVRLEPHPPRLDDLWSEKLYDFDTDLQYFPEVIDGQEYKVAIISKRALFPTRSGRIDIPPFAAGVGLAYAGSMTQTASPAMTLEVKPLPAGAPPGFDPTWVGEWAADAQIDRAEIQAGDGVTLTVRLRGTGAIGRVAVPTLRLPGFKLRAPRDREQRVDTSGGRVSGELLFRFFATPEHGGNQSISSLELAYFSPRSGRYQIAQTDPIALRVNGEPPAGRDGGEDHFIAPDIRLIRDGATIASVSTRPLHRRAWFWLLAAVPPLGYAGLRIAERLRRRRDPGGRGRTRQRLRSAAAHLRAQHAAEFFAELARALDDRLGEALGQPARALTRPQLGQLLLERGFSAELIQRITDELDNCDFARFTPAASAPDEMRAALERTRALVDEIDRAGAAAAAEREAAGEAQP
jgi:oxygen tolerance protein BatD